MARGMIILETVSEGRALEREVFWIETYVAEGARLTTHGSNPKWHASMRDFWKRTAERQGPLLLIMLPQKPGAKNSTRRRG